MEFHQNGKWTLTQLPEGGWQLEEQVRHEDQLGAIILSSNLQPADLVSLQTAIQSVLGYETCQKCESAHPADQHAPTYSRWLRSLADYDNLSKRIKVDLSQAQFDTAKKILTELLLLADNITAVLDAVGKRGENITQEEQGILRSSLESVLQKNEVLPIFPGMQPTNIYNPDWHQAVEMSESDVTETTVVPLMQGYLWRDKVLRVAQVRVLTPKKEVV